MSENIHLKEQWRLLCKFIEDTFQPEGDVDVDGILFLIGVQELGKGHRRFKKDEKINLLHIAICRVLEPYGYYEFEGTDSDGWPHYKLIEPLPNLRPGEQSLMMKEAIIRYFDDTTDGVYRKENSL
ncbi:MAG: hypothetical protein LAT54_00340 [Cryomorphaceae bacterium]|nr:hypothetical protein [Cryomorphaceae bacterium]